MKKINAIVFKEKVNVKILIGNEEEIPYSLPLGTTITLSGVMEKAPAGFLLFDDKTHRVSKFSEDFIKYLRKHFGLAKKAETFCMAELASKDGTKAPKKPARQIDLEDE